MPPRSTPRRRAAPALALVAIALLAAPAAAQPQPQRSPAVGAARAQGTPVITPPAKRTLRPLTCRVSRRVRACVARRTTCSTRDGVRTCRSAIARCRLAGRLKRCRVITITCTRTAARPDACRRASVRRTTTLAFAVRAGLAIPRMLSRAAASAPAAAAPALVSSRPGAQVAPPLLPVAASGQATAAGVATGIGVLALALALMAIMLARRRPRRDA